MAWLNSPTPAWVTAATGIVALLSLIVAFATFRRAGPRIRMRVNVKHSAEEPGSLLHVRLNNSGLASIDVRRIRVSSLLHLARLEVLQQDRISGDLELGQSLGGGREVEGAFSLNRVLDDHLAELSISSDRQLAFRLFRAELRSIIPRRAWGWFIPLYPLVTSVAWVEVDLGNGSQVSRAPLSLAWGVHRLVRERLAALTLASQVQSEKPPELADEVDQQQQVDQAREED